VIDPTPPDESSPPRAASRAAEAPSLPAAARESDRREAPPEPRPVAEAPRPSAAPTPPSAPADALRSEASPEEPAAERPAAPREARAATDRAPAAEPTPAGTGATRPAPAPAPAATAPGPAPAPSPETPDLILRAAQGLERQLGAKAREFLNRGRTQLRIALDPPRLGHVRVELDLTEHRASARIVTQTAEAAALLTRDREELVRAFQAQGIDDVRVQVDADPDGSTGRRHDGEEWEDEAGVVPAAVDPEGRGVAADPARSHGIDLIA
jgi:flagellar hook-length control protein FliK